MKGMGNMMKQAQQLQSKMMKLQEELAEKTVESSSGGGMVRVTANGRQQILSIQIEKEVVDPDDVEMLQDLIMAAINDALAKAQEMLRVTGYELRVDGQIDPKSTIVNPVTRNTQHATWTQSASKLINSDQ
jgi:DNA-binding YbaB/EbfC family protein